MTPDPKALVEARERLTRFAGSDAFGGESGNTVYPGGIFCLDGPNPFYADLRRLLAAPAPPPKDGPALDREGIKVLVREAMCARPGSFSAEAAILNRLTDAILALIPKPNLAAVSVEGAAAIIEQHLAAWVEDAEHAVGENERVVICKPSPVWSRRLADALAAGEG